MIKNSLKKNALPKDQNDKLNLNPYDYDIKLGNTAISLHRVTDLDFLMEDTLTEARKFLRAEAGSIYLKQNNELVLSYTQNDILDAHLEDKTILPYQNMVLDINSPGLAPYVGKYGVALNIKDAYAIDKNAGYQYCTELDEKTGYKCRAIVTLPLINIEGDTMGVLQLINPLDEKGNVTYFKKRDLEILNLFASNASMAIDRAKAFREMLMRAIKMAKLRDPKETSQHAHRVGALSVELYQNWAKSKNINNSIIRKNADVLHMSAMMHDIGKVGISDQILLKPGRLTDEERTIMEKHVVIGAKLFSGGVSLMDKMTKIVILNHHEHWNGNGYPGWVDEKTFEPINSIQLHPLSRKGKKGFEIPIFGRIVALADVFDALSSKRVYKEAFPQEMVLDIIKNNKGEQFDPELVDILLQKIDIAKAIVKKFPDYS